MGQSNWLVELASRTNLIWRTSQLVGDVGLVVELASRTNLIWRTSQLVGDVGVAPLVFSVSSKVQLACI
jgi:hypothetical protein